VMSAKWRNGVPTKFLKKKPPFQMETKKLSSTGSLSRHVGHPEMPKLRASEAWSEQ
jgi:hypothetical protein